MNDMNDAVKRDLAALVAQNTELLAQLAVAEQAASDQSRDVQLNWLSPVEAHGLRAQLAELMEDRDSEQRWANEYQQLAEVQQAKLDERDASIAALWTSLIKIAAFTECSGPGCYFCENEDERGHPYSVEATIAQEALTGKGREK